MRPARRVFIKRMVLPLLCFAVVRVYVERAHGHDISFWITRQGERAGCGVALSRVYAIGPDGPFFGDDLKHAAWNFAWRHAEWAAATGAGFAAAAGAYVLCAWPLGRTRPFGYRGPTLCGACGYRLAGLTEPRCPECGRRV